MSAQANAHPTTIDAIRLHAVAAMHRVLSEVRHLRHFRRGTGAATAAHIKISQRRVQEVLAEYVGVGRTTVGRILKECAKPPMAETHIEDEPEQSTEPTPDPAAVEVARRRAAEAQAAKLAEHRRAAAEALRSPAVAPEPIEGVPTPAWFGLFNERPDAGARA